MRLTPFVLLLPSFAIGLLGCNSLEPKQSSTTISGELAAREAIESILFDQRTHYIENQSFAATLQDLGGDGIATKSPHYTYQLKTKHSKASGIVVTASPKRANLRSFTGVVFAIPTSQGKLTISEICETINPSQRPPTAPTIPKHPSDAIQCPAGSRSTFAIVAER